MALSPRNSLAVLAIISLLVCATAQGAWAITPEIYLADTAQEARARKLFHALRCTVCQGESIADSPASIAQSLRQEVRDRIQNGESDEAILALLTQQYGEGILMTPPLTNRTALLWFGPLLALLAGTSLVVAYFRAPKAGEP